MSRAALIALASLALTSGPSSAQGTLRNDQTGGSHSRLTSALRLTLPVSYARGLRNQSAPCKAVTAADVAPIVGAAAMKTVGNGCSWTADKEHYVAILDNTPRGSGMPVAAMFNAARKAAAGSGTVTDESGLGDKAFLAVSSSGVAALQMLKGDHLLQVQVWTGGAPSAATLALVRKIGARAVAAF